MISAVDTNILLDILLPDPVYGDGSKSILDQAYSEGSLIICEAVYAELLCQFADADTMEAFLSDTGIRLVPTEPAALAQAAFAWKTYVQRRGTHLQCPRCGYRQKVKCPQCGVTVTSRQHIVTDFLVGAHALAEADCLLSRDRGFYGTYFPSLRVKDPTHLV